MSQQYIKGRAFSDQSKQKLLELLLTSWKQSSQLRLGQLIDNAIVNQDIPLFNLEDDSLINLVQEFVLKLSNIRLQEKLSDTNNK